ncbi:hypothetical protein C7S17_7095 [Burkholderia thailandensis]|nr:hypothetical protein [Burkholderia thailandensis]
MREAPFQPGEGALQSSYNKITRFYKNNYVLNWMKLKYA